MYKIGDYVINKKDVYKIIDIKEKYMKDVDYYVLESVADSSLKVKVPITSKSLRDVISIARVNEIINNMINIECLDVDDKNIENTYKELLNNPTHENLIKIIKTSYLRNKNRIESKRKISDKDKNYFDQAEKYLYTEFSVALGKTFEDTKQYVISEVEKLHVHE